MDAKRLYRSRHNRMICGICGGLGEFFGIDPTILRLLLVVIAFCTAIFGTAIAYLIAAVIIPEEP